jgi:hypothetical protein
MTRMTSQPTDQEDPSDPAGQARDRRPPRAGCRPAPDKSGTAGLAATGVSIALTFTVAVLGTSLMEPPLPGRAGQPPWAFDAHPSPYLVVALTAAALAAGAAGLALTMRATRRGWSVSPRAILIAGILCAAALALVPPFGSSDHLSYAAYGRIAVTGHDPYTTTPAALARLGDPVARAVEDWRNSPSVYGSLATGLQALASAIGGTSVRLTVFVLSLLNVAAFAVTGLLLHRLARRDARRQLRAGLLWTLNPLLLQVLVAGGHVDSQGIIFGIAGLAAFSSVSQNDWRSHGPVSQAGAAAGAGALIGLAFAVKATLALIGAGLAVACVLAWHAGRSGGGAEPGARPAGPPARALHPALLLGGLAAGFCVAAGASLVRWGPGSLLPALREGNYVSIGSPWRAVRSALRLAIGEATAEDVVKAGAVLLALALLALLLRSITADGSGRWPDVPGLAHRPPDRAGLPGGAAALVTCCAFAVAFAWLIAWPYVLPWYDALGWALLALLPASRLDWLMLARTTALAFGYLPARVAGIVVPAGLSWLRTVVRTGVTPAVLLAVTVVLVVLLWRQWRVPLTEPAAAGPAGPSGAARRGARSRGSQLPS